jgi:lipoprotein-anchoring transpeptidase ErfK/SrfK
MYGDEQSPYDEWGSPTTYGSSGRPTRSGGPRPPRRRSSAVIATVIGVAAVALVAAITASRLGNRDHSRATAASPTGSHSAAGQSSGSKGKATKPVRPAGPTHPVHISLFQGDGQTYGIGIPIIAQFSKNVTDAHAFNKAVRVTVNGQPADGAWFWVKSNGGYAMEAHFRPQHYWPAHSKVQMSMPLKGVSAGKGLAFDDSLTLSMNIGAAHISQVNGATEQMVITSDGKEVNHFPVSLGQASTPTYLGTKVVMAKKNPQHMVSAPGEANPYSLDVPWSVRLTNSGEFVHAAAWNTGNIGSRSTSHGCTNLTVADAKWFYNFAVIGDVVTYTNTGATQQMPSWDGFGDWNVPWSIWSEGNLLQN